MLRTVFRYTLGTFTKVLVNTVKYPFSKSSRHKLSAAFLALQYPFYGDRNLELSELLTNTELQVSVAPVKSNLHNITEF